MAVFLQIFSLFLVMAAGWGFTRLGYLDKEGVRGISNLILKLTLPCLIVVSLQKPFSRELLSVSLMTLGAATVYYMAAIALSLLAVRLLGTPQRQRGALTFALAFSNCAFVGFPVVASIRSGDALFILSIHNVLFNLLAFTAGVRIMEGKTGRGMDLMKILNVNVLATAAGFALFLLSVPLPAALRSPLESLGSLTTPLAMIVTGSMLARTSLKTAVGDWRVFAVSALRLALWPLLAWAALRAFRVGPDLSAITVIVAGMPAASNTGIIAEIYGGDTETASSAVFVSTLLSVLTIPLLAMFLG